MTTEREPDSTFRDLLRRHRLAVGLTQEELAERAGLSARGISDLERGVRGYPHPDTVRRLAAALGLDDGAHAAFLQAVPRLPARSAEAPATERRAFPSPLTPLIGRDDEIAAIRRWVVHEGHRLVTLHGPGGMGKTRLALAAAEQMAGAFRDGQAFVDLAPVRDPALLVTQIAAALGVQEHAGQALQETLGTSLRPRQMLIVLDNFEQLLNAAPVLTDLLHAAPELSLLVTSRAPLRLQGERLFQVPPLGGAAGGPDDLEAARVDAAATLFVTRVHAIEADFALTAENAATVLAICRRLEGVPLALELAAARTSILPLATLRDRLATALPLLTGGARDAPLRHRSLREAIAWSDDLLEPAVRVFFHRLGIFVGGWTLEAAEAVAAGDGALDVIDGLAALRDLNLIRIVDAGAEPRYTMLETIREYAQACLAASPEADQIARAHAAFYRRFASEAAQRLYGHAQGEWTRRLDAEMPNLRATLQTLAQHGDVEAHLRVVVDLGDYWFRRSHFAEGRGHLEEALARDAAPSLAQASAMLWAGALSYGQGDMASAERWLRQCEARARAQDAVALIFDALFWQGVVADAGGKGERALAYLESALAVARERDYQKGIGSALTALAPSALYRGELDLAEEWAIEALPYLQAAGDVFDLSMSYAGLGEIALARGDPDGADRAFREAMAYARSCDVAWLVANVLVGFAAVALARDDPALAAQYLGASDRVRTESLHATVPSNLLHAETTRLVRAALGEDDFLRAWDIGQGLTREEALERIQTKTSGLAGA